jgi:hypothetical protein
MPNEGSPVHFLNIEYFFRLLYALLHGGGSVAANSISTEGLFTFFNNLWLGVTIFSYLFSLAAIGVFTYSLVRLHQVREEERPRYETKSEPEEHEKVEHDRWSYISELIESGQQSDWRQAIIEADIMLDDMLTRLGYEGESVGEKLRAVNANQFQTLNNAWEAHKVRNEIAHQGSAFELSERLAHRTIANYEAAFREHGEI